MYETHEKIGDIVENSYTPRLQGSTNVADALEAMDEYEADVIGVECECDFIGVFSRHELEKQIIRWNLHPKEATLYEVITYNPPYVTADLSVIEAYNAMLAYQWEYIPVVSGKTLLGIALLSDLRGRIIQSSGRDDTFETDTILADLPDSPELNPEYIQMSY